MIEYDVASYTPSFDWFGVRHFDLKFIIEEEHATNPILHQCI